MLKGFASGADDYLPKPFDLAILLARIRSLLRRREWAGTLLSDPPADARIADAKQHDQPREFDVYRFGGKQVDFGTLELHSEGQSFRLTLMEAELLRFLIRERGKECRAQADSGAGLGIARGHRHARHRQLHRQPAQVHRARSRQAAPSADSARRGIPVHSRSAAVAAGVSLSGARQDQRHVIRLLGAANPIGNRGGHRLADAGERLIAM